MKVERTFKHRGDVGVLAAAGDRVLIGGEVEESSSTTLLGIVDLKSGDVRFLADGKQAGSGGIQDFKCLAVSPDGRLAVSGHGAWGGIQAWDLDTGQHLRPLSGGMYIGAVAFDADGARVFGVDHTNHLSRFRVSDWALEDATRFEHALPYVKEGEGTPAVHEEEPHNDGCLFLPGAQELLVVTSAKPEGSDLVELRRSDEPGKCRWSVAHAERLDTLCVSSNGQRIATSGWGDVISIWDAATGSVVTQLRLAPVERGRNRTAAAAFSPDGKRLVTTHPGPAVHLWDVDSATLLETLPLPGRGTPADVVVAGSSTAFVALWSTVHEISF